MDDALAAALLAEDFAGADLTTETLALSGRPGRITFSARAACVVAGVELAERMLTLAGVAVARRRASGERVAPGDLLLSGEGDARALHAGWKSAQTLVEALSGIATAARAIVDAAEAVDAQVRVACTRKTFPGARRLSQAAVKAGGAILHRADLSETILVFPEHLAFLGDASLAEVAATLRRRAPEKKPAIEVGSVAAAQAAIEAGFEIVQLEKFSAADVAAVAAFARRRRPAPLIAAAGGVNAGNAADYVRAGAGLLVTSAPYSAPPCDVQVRIAPL
jgi:molybdenum transport protein